MDNHKRQNYFLLRSFTLISERCPNGDWTAFPVTQDLYKECRRWCLISCFATTDSHLTSAHLICCPLHNVLFFVFFPQYVLNGWVEQEDTQTHKERESVLTVLYLMLVTLLIFFVSSCVALNQQWSPATVGVILFLFIFLIAELINSFRCF